MDEHKTTRINADSLSDILKAFGDSEVPVAVSEATANIEDLVAHGSYKEVMSAIDKFPLKEDDKILLKIGVEAADTIAHYEDLFAAAKAAAMDRNYDISKKLLGLLHKHAHLIKDEMDAWDRDRKGGNLIRKGP